MEPAEKQPSSRRLSVPVMFAFGVGGIGQAAITMGIYGFLLFYYQYVSRMIEHNPQLQEFCLQFF